MNADQAPDDLIGLAEACRLLPSPRPGRKISCRSVRRWVTKGKLPGWVIHGIIYVSRADVLALPRRKVPRSQVQAPPKMTAAQRRAEDEWADRQLAAAKLVR